jgi:IS6 family transposase
VQRFTPLLIDTARPCRHAVGMRWFVDETYVKVAGVWCHLRRAHYELGAVAERQQFDVTVRQKGGF